MRTIGKNKELIASVNLNSNDTYYVEMDGIYTACKIKSFKIKMYLSSRGREYNTLCECTLLTAHDMQEHKIIFWASRLIRLHSICINSARYISFYLTKEEVCNNRPHIISQDTIITKLADFMGKVGAFNIYVWDRVKTIRPTTEAVPVEYRDKFIMEYDLLSDTLYMVDENQAYYINEIGEKVYYLKEDCENDNVPQIIDFE